ncbi:MAG TPA: cupredoxin family copper-binding protein [Pseudonocardiaceae bacterium]
MRHFRTRVVLPAVAAGITIIAGCGGPATASAPDAPAPVAPAPVAASGQDAPVATNAVTIQNFAFTPATVTVKAGTTITWTNRDQDPHTVTAMAGPLRSPTLNTGESFHYTFTTPGRVDYLCTIHPFMTATVVVTP